jgi:predicted dehydrogenase
LLEYADATGIIEASWNWPFGIKDMEVFGEKGYLHALNGNTLEERKDTGTYSRVDVKPYIYKDNLAYLAAALKGEASISNDPSSLENNVIVVKILEAARESAKTGKAIKL